jgi:hypothetical protein
MPETQEQSPKIPPDIARYLAGATAESLQFDFLIGDWRVEGARHDADGKILLTYVGSWSARYLHDRRMVMDDFAVCAPTGQEVSAFVTLRTYCDAAKRWEMAGLAAFQPAIGGTWFGHWVDGEMRLVAEALGPNGKTIKNEIRFFAIQPDGFQWESRNSHDDGKTWSKVASLAATRKS